MESNLQRRESRLARDGVRALVRNRALPSLNVFLIRSDPQDTIYSRVLGVLFLCTTIASHMGERGAVVGYICVV